MKMIVCELCGSNKFTKKDEYFVCDYCNTSYTKESAKKLMVEGSVKIDTSDERENLKTLINEAFDSNSYEDLKNYSEKLLLLEPNNSIAKFGKLIGKSGISGLKSYDLNELTSYIIKYNNECSDSDKELYKKYVRSVTGSTYLAIINAQANFLAKYADSEDVSNLFLSNVEIYMSVPKVLMDNNFISNDEYKQLQRLVDIEIVALIHSTVSVWKEEFYKDNHPMKNVFPNTADLERSKTFAFKLIISKLVMKFHGLVEKHDCYYVFQIMNTEMFRTNMNVSGASFSGNDKQFNYYIGIELDNKIKQFMNDYEFINNITVHDSWNTNYELRDSLLENYRDLTNRIDSLSIFSGKRKKELELELEKITSYLSNDMNEYIIMLNSPV